MTFASKLTVKDHALIEQLREERVKHLQAARDCEAQKQEKKILTESDWILAGQEKGVVPRAGESMANFKRRVEVALR